MKTAGIMALLLAAGLSGCDFPLPESDVAESEPSPWSGDLFTMRTGIYSSPEGDYRCFTNASGSSVFCMAALEEE